MWVLDSTHTANRLAKDAVDVVDKAMMATEAPGTTVSITKINYRRPNKSISQTCYSIKVKSSTKDCCSSYDCFEFFFGCRPFTYAFAVSCVMPYKLLRDSGLSVFSCPGVLIPTHC